MGLKHAVITSVARDELKDGGASIWAATIRAVRAENPQTAIEVLIPDFKGRWEDLDTVLEAKPDILNHNVETVPRLHKMVRPQARYERSLEMLRRAKAAGFVTKSGLMLGIGEEQDEIAATLRDMAADKLDILTLGQYLRPSAQHLPLYRWVTPDEFAHWKRFSLDLGFKVVESGPLVRSSYHADEQSDALVPGTRSSIA
jgi:lipoic acid synthetase